MIWLQLKGRLGNQMFQYAATRTMVEARGLEMVYSATLGQRNLLQPVFPLPGEVACERLVNRLRRPLWQRRTSSDYTPPYIDYTDRCNAESFDPQFGAIPDGTRVNGWLQSHEYFERNRAEVLRWFTPRRDYLDRLEQVERQIPAPRERRCCVHVRLTDYKVVDAGLSAGSDGWALPAAYYQHALREVPQDLHLVVISDDPDTAETFFDGRKNKTVIRGNPGIVDMFLMTRCRANIISNSSFSWWGAWCNELPRREIIAPTYHLGWHIGKWCPDRIRVAGWRYLEVPR